MTNDIKISRELAERLTECWNGTDARIELRALLAKTICSKGILCGDITCECKGNGVFDKIAAPVVESQEPVYQVQYLGDGGGGWSDVDKESYDMKTPHHKHWMTRIVYTSPPAPVAVVLPARRDTPEYWNPYQNPSAERACGWNGYDDELKRLNPGLFAKVKD